MKKLLMTITVLILVTVGGVIGYAICKNGQDEQSMNFTATTLVQSFGWEIKEHQETVTYRLSEEMFHSNYYHITGGNAAKPTAGSASGNIDGISPEILNRGFFISNNQNVHIYEFPIVYDMPNGTSLQSVIAFHEGKICMSSVQLRFENVDSFIHQIENLDEDTQDILIPTTWPLNVEKQVIEEWKDNYIKYVG